MQVSINCVCGGTVTVDETYADGHARCPACNRSIFVPAELFREAHVADAPAGAPARPAAPAAGRPAAPAPQAPVTPAAPPQQPAEAPPQSQAQPVKAPAEQAQPPAQAAPTAAPAAPTEAPAAPSGSGLPGGSTGSGMAGTSKRPVAPPDKSARPIKIQPRVEEPPPKPRKKSPLPMVLVLLGLLVILGGGIYALILVFTGGRTDGPVPAAEIGRPVVRVKTGAGVCHGFFISDTGYMVTNLELVPSDASLTDEGGAKITVEFAVKAGDGWVGRTATVRRVALRDRDLQLAVLKVDLAAGTQVCVPPLAEDSNQGEGATWYVAHCPEGVPVSDEPRQLAKSLEYPLSFSLGSERYGTDITYEENKALDGAPVFDSAGKVFAIALFLPSSSGQTLLYYLCTMTRPLANRLLEKARGSDG